MYRINDIFYSLQGEGHNTGRAAAFIRFAGCNLHCAYCDTDFGSYQEMDAIEILTTLRLLTVHVASDLRPLVVLTGGEPTLQADERLVDLLHDEGYEVAMESNGTRPAPRNIDWLTISPKTPLAWKEREDWRQPDELKIVFGEHTCPDSILSSLPSPAEHPLPLLYLQPCDTGDATRNALIVRHCVDYIRQHPQWRLSLQTHKLIGIK
ncbi:MAG: 7-carboxy-7-deazaguanine synthase QueE [Prevotella sp.]|nr:7-carboxy-7-deazaguanine synthase QueE [Prevotella sp.]